MALPRRRLPTTAPTRSRNNACLPFHPFVAVLFVAALSSASAFSNPPLLSPSRPALLHHGRGRDVVSGQDGEQQRRMAAVRSSDSPVVLSMVDGGSSSSEASASTATTVDETQPGKVQESPAAANDVDDDDDEDWEYEEYEYLTESDFYNSEWKIGTVFDRNPNKIVETWARLVVQTEDGVNVAVWGDGSKGKWSFDVSNQFFSISKESFGGWRGKQIWAGTVDDFYYVQGSVRGWSPISPASVLGQWQARRLGVDKEEAGVAPWFDDKEEEGGASGGVSDDDATSG